MTADELVAKLKTQAAVESLAGVAIETVLAQPLGQLFPPEKTVETVRALLEGWASSEAALPALESLLNEAHRELAHNPKALRDALGPRLQHMLTELVRLPQPVDRRVVLALIDRPPMRALVRSLLLEAVLDVGRSLRSPVAGMAKGLSGFAKMAAEAAKARAGSLGTFVGAVGDEVERQIERRATELVDAGLARVMGQIADAVSDPSKAHEAAELRAALLEGALSLTLPQLAHELKTADLVGAAKVLRQGLTSWLASDDAKKVLAAHAAFLTRLYGARTLREVLSDAGWLDGFKAGASTALGAALPPMFASEAFGQWLRSQWE